MRNYTTTKEQVDINFAKDVIEKLDRKPSIGWSLFRSCNAYIGEEITLQVDEDIFEDSYIEVVPIKSYSTIVGFADVTNGIVYEYGKYSPTTSKQFTQIYTQRFSNYDRVLVQVDTSDRW